MQLCYTVLSSTVHGWNLEKPSVRFTWNGLYPAVSAAYCTCYPYYHYPIISVCSLFEVPVLGTYPTIDELSDKSKYEYFMRLVPPARFEVKAMMEFLESFNFSYISILFGDDTYGESLIL